MGLLPPPSQVKISPDMELRLIILSRSLFRFGCDFKSHLSFCICCLLFTLFCVPANAQFEEPSLLNFWRSSVDFQGNIPAKSAQFPNGNPAIEELNTDPFPGGHYVTHVVYKKGDEIHGVTKFYNDNFSPFTYVATPTQATLTSPSANQVIENGGPLNEVKNISTTITSGASGVIPAYGTVTIEWTLNGVPNHLCAGHLSVPVRFDIFDPINFTQYVNYDLLGTVTLAIMTANPVDTMSVPWADFAYHVGLWGWGATTTSEAYEKLVDGIHYSERHYFKRNIYDPESPRFYQYPIQERPYFRFDMTGLLSRLEIGNIAMDCQDFSSVLSYAVELNGINGELRRFQSQSGSGGFDTSPVCKAGNDSKNDLYYLSIPFNFHVALKALSRISDSAVSYKHNLLGQIHKNPAFNWSLPDYWQTSAGFGLCLWPLNTTYNFPVYNNDRQITFLI